jgi:VCBS repeat-containing protein
MISYTRRDLRRSLLIGLLLSAIIIAPFQITASGPAGSPSPTAASPTASPPADQSPPDQSPPPATPAPTAEASLPDESSSPAPPPIPSPTDTPAPTPAVSPAGESPSPAPTEPPATEPPATDPPVSPSPSATEPPARPSPPLADLPYLVRFADVATFAQRGELFAASGIVEDSSVAALRLASIRIPLDGADQTIASLRANPQIVSVEPDRERTIEAAPDDARYGDQWALPRIGWPSVWSGAAPGGQSLVAILDTGVDSNHPDLAGQLVDGASFVDGVSAGTDANGHGTWMAGIVAATANNGEGIAGVGLGAVRVMPVTVIGADGSGSDSDIINGIVYAVDHGADVILMAFSSRGYSAALQQAIDYGWDAGVVLVAAVGNDGTDQATYPAGDAGVVGVSATEPDDSLWPSSNSGSDVFLGAPGDGILTTAPGAEYVTVSGTSAAAAYVAGSAGLLLAEDHSLANGVVVGRLARSAATAGARPETGNGRLDLARAWSDASVEPVKPAGVHDADGGPFVGPFTQPGSGDGGPYTVAAAAFRSAAQAGITSGVTSLVINKPTGTIAGDVMIAAIGFRPNTATISPPSGWTPIRRTDNTNPNQNSQATYYRIADSSEGSSYTWTLGASPTGAAGGIASFLDLSSCALVDVQNGAITANALTHDAPTVNTTASGDMLVTTHSFASAATWTPPAGMNEAVDVASDVVPTTAGVSLEMNYLVLGAAGATGAKTAAASNDSDVGVGQTVALRSSCTKTWDGGAVTSNWGDTANWNPDGVPTGSDNVSLTGANTINIDVAAATNDLTLNNASLVLTVNSGKSLTVTGNCTLSGGTLNTQASFPTVSGTTSIGAGTTVGYTAASGSQTVATLAYANLTISGGGTKTLAGTITPSGNLTVSGGTLDLSSFTANRASAGGTLTVSNGATLKIGGTGTVPSNYSTHSVGATSTIEFAGTTTTVVALNSSQNYGNLVISGTGVTTAATITVATALTVNGGGSLVASAGTVTMANGSSISNSGTLTFRGLTIPASATVTTSSGFSVLAALTTGSAAVFNPSGGTITLSSTAWTLALTSAPTFRGLTIAGTPTTQPSASFAVAGALTVNGSTTLAPTAGTITMNNGSSIANSGTLTFQALSIAASASVSASASFTVAGTFTVNSSATFTPAAAAVVSGAGTLTGSGTIQVTRTAATADFSSQYTITNKTLTNLTVDYAGAAAQVISALTYGSLKLSNTSGAALAGSVTVNVSLTLAGGMITTSSSTLASVSGSVTRTSGYVVGNLQMPVPTGAPSVTFHIGDATAYTPVAITFASVTTGGSLTATTAAGDHAQIGSSSIVAARSVNRTWTLTGSGIVFTTYSATLTFVSGDVDAGANTANFIVDRYSGGAWVTPGTGTRTSTSTQATGVPGFGDLAVGQRSLGIFTDSQDIGGPTLAGSASYNSGSYTVSGSGADIWGTADQFQYVYRQVSGDVRITARVVSMTNTDPWAKAGVMIRESTATGSVHGHSMLSYANGYAFQWRPTTNQATVDSEQAGLAVPYWVRLTRVGNTFTAERSSDGTNWTVQGSSQTITMATTVLVGLSVTAHTNSALNTSVFDNVSVDSPPTAVADVYAAQPGTLLAVSAAAGVLANDSDPDNDSLTASLVSGVGSGTLNLSSDGSFTYTSNGGFVGTDSFTYRAFDGNLYSATMTVTIYVIGSVGFEAEDYVAGTATGAGFTTLNEGSALNGQAITTNGNNTNAAGPPPEMVRYNVYFPNAGATNSYHLYMRYRLPSDDTNHDSGWALLPLDSSTSTGSNWDQINDLYLTGTTTYGWVDLTAAAGGINGVGTYANVSSGLHTWWFGGREAGVYADAFVFSTTGSLDTSGAGQAYLDSVVNDRPMAVADSYSVNEDGSLNVSAAGVLANDTDPENDSLTASLVSNVSNGSLTLNANGSFTYTPGANFNGADSFTYLANDSMVSSAASATVTITVNAVNDVPSFTKGANQAVNEDAGAQSVAGWATALSAGPANESSQTLNFIVSNDNNGLFSVQPAISATGTLTYTPAANANGSTTVTVQIHDNGGTANGGVDTSASQTFTITVNAVNDVPSFTKGANQAVNEDAGAQSVAGWATALSAGPANESSQTLNFIVSNDNNGLFSVQPAISATGTLTYTPAANANGSTTVTVQIHDNGGTANGGVDTSASQTFTITVNPVNDAPVNALPGTQATAVNMSIVFSNAGGNAISISDIDAGSSAVQVQLTGTSGTLTLSGTSGLSFTVGDGTADATMTFTGTISAINTALNGLTFSPSNQFTGTASVQIVTNDQGATGSGGAKSDTDSVSINVINTPPTGAADAYSTTQGNALLVAAPGVLANDTDPDPQTLTVQTPRPVSGPSNGSLTLNANGSFTYTPTSGFTGTDSFTYKATDGLADSALTTVTLTVNTTAYVSSSAWTASFGSTRYLDFSFPAYVAAGSTVEGATFRHSYRSYTTGTTCYYFEVYSGGSLIGSHGSSGAPVSCNSGSSYVTDTVSLPEVDSMSRANSITIRLYVRNSAGGRSEHSLATLGVTYWLGNP